MTNDGLELITPKIRPALDATFRPASLASRAFRKKVEATGDPVPVRLALEQADGSIFHFQTAVFAESRGQSGGNFRYLERLVKFLLWSRGGYRVYFDGPQSLHTRLAAHYADTATGRFDAEIMGGRIYEKPFEIVRTKDIPPARESSAALGRHLQGCRIGFDLGGSDRKVAAVIDGKVVFSEEIVWNPVPQKDPRWHFDQINDSLKRAAAHLPRVDGIGGSSAGVYVNNRVKVASLFRGVPPDLFQSRVKNLFIELRQAWGNIPFEVANDGEVTALAGSMALGKNSVFGLALGTSTAAGYVTPEGNITTWLNELAFAPIDFHPNAPADEWSGDYGCGVQYFSQQCVGRLIPIAGVEVDPALPLPEKLKHVQKLMDQNDERARKIYQTIGTYLGYAVAHYTDFYDIRHILILGRVTSGHGADLILAGAREVLTAEFPDLGERIEFHVPDEKEKRHGQAIAAASLPSLSEQKGISTKITN
ncbi:MAG TPA: ROK family protein [Verrucomicrobiae bacterium]|jgi:predicted NBD/HSP70 family sugar kinase|nr:ROK family protein [Verrucomicrobiae bacterium]